jgi:hypothetical protein
MSASFLRAATRREQDVQGHPEAVLSRNPLTHPAANPLASHVAIVAELNDIVASAGSGMASSMLSSSSSSGGGGGGGGSSSTRLWRCQVAPSVQTGAGWGVFVRGGRCPAGRVVAAYPGVSYEADDLTVMHKLVLPGNEYVMFRRDGVLIDGRPDGPSKQMWEMAEQRERAAGKPALDRDNRSNELAIGNMVNHPPGGTQPNVVVHPIDLAPDEQVHLHQHLPIVNFRPPAPGDPCKRTVVLISARDIAEDEELYLDYKLRADGPRESWYVPVVYPEAALRRDEAPGASPATPVSGSAGTTPATATPEPSPAVESAAVAAVPVVAMSSNVGRTPPNRFGGTATSFHSARGGNL